MIPEFTVLHNARCSTSRTALDVAQAAGVDVEVRHYLKQPLTTEELRELVALFDEPTQLVRRDANFAKLGLADDDVAAPEQVVAVLAEHPELLQRPVLIRRDADGARAIVGRPRDAVPGFLRGE